jgi:hypothetical protein
MPATSCAPPTPPRSGDVVQVRTIQSGPTTGDQTNRHIGAERRRTGRCQRTIQAAAELKSDRERNRGRRMNRRSENGTAHHEHFRALYSAARGDVLVDGGDRICRDCVLSVPTGRTFAACRFSDHPGKCNLARGESRRCLALPERSSAATRSPPSGFRLIHIIHHNRRKRHGQYAGDGVHDRGQRSDCRRRAVQRSSPRVPQRRRDQDPRRRPSDRCPVRSDHRCLPEQ